MKLRSLLLVGIACILALSTGCANIIRDLTVVTPQSVNQDVYIGMSKDAVIQKYGNEIYLKGKTVSNDEELYAYVFADQNSDVAHNMFSFVNNVFAVTIKHLFILFDHNNKVKDFKVDGLFVVEAVGFYSYRAFVHPLNEVQLASATPMSFEEGKESYFRYLTDVKGIDRSIFTKQDLEGNRETFIHYGFIVKDDAESFVGPLKDVIINDEKMLDEMSQEVKPQVQ